MALVKRSNGRALHRYLCSILIIIAIISVGIVVIVAAARREGKGKFANEIRIERNGFAFKYIARVKVGEIRLGRLPEGE